eukprot:scaffold249274_cov31-Tisochrysis_lutea.AAC.6
MRGGLALERDAEVSDGLATPAQNEDTRNEVSKRIRSRVRTQVIGDRPNRGPRAKKRRALVRQGRAMTRGGGRCAHGGVARPIGNEESVVFFLVEVMIPRNEEQLHAL